MKRMQGLYQGTLVAQGAFSLYRAQALLVPIAVVGYGQELLGLRRRWK